MFKIVCKTPLFTKEKLAPLFRDKRGSHLREAIIKYFTPKKREGGANSREVLFRVSMV